MELSDLQYKNCSTQTILSPVLRGMSSQPYIEYGNLKFYLFFLKTRKEALEPRPKRRKKTKNSGVIHSTSLASSLNHTAFGRDYPAQMSPIASGSGQIHQTVCKYSTDLCELCGLKPVDGAFIHGKTGHELYCYSCSNRLCREKKKCPVCRRTIGKVVKMFKGSHVG